MSHFQFTEKRVQQNTEQRERSRIQWEPFHGKGEPVENVNSLSSNYDLHLSFLLKDRCIHSPSNLSPLSEFQEHS